MIAIPYAGTPYRNDDYVTRMADLMLRRGEAQAQAARQRGDASAQRWAGVGNVALSTMAQYGQHKDAEKARAMQLHQQAIENARAERAQALQERELTERGEDRRDDQEWRRTQFRDQSARNSAEDMAPGAVVPAEDFSREFAGTSAARRFAHRPAEDARLPARGINDMQPIAGYQGLQPDDVADPMGRSMSADVSAKPERFVRTPNFAERKSSEELELRREANYIAQQNTIADNTRADAAQRATDEYRRARLSQGGRERMPTTASLALAAAKGDPNAQKALDIVRRAEGGRSPQQIANFMTISGQYQRSPLVAAADRTVVLADSIKAIRENPKSPSAQMNLAYSYIQALDTYQSAVREGELQNLGQLTTKLDQLRVAANKIATEGAFMPPDLAIDIANNSERLVSAITAARQAKAADFGKRARVAGVGDMWDAYQTTGQEPAVAPPNAGWFDAKKPGGQ